MGSVRIVHLSTQSVFGLHITPLEELQAALGLQFAAFAYIHSAQKPAQLVLQKLRMRNRRHEHFAVGFLLGHSGVIHNRVSVGKGLSIAIERLQLARITVTHQPLRARLHSEGAAPVVVRLNKRQSVGLRARHRGAVDAQVLVLILDLFLVSRVCSSVRGISRLIFQRSSSRHRLSSAGDAQRPSSPVFTHRGSIDHVHGVVRGGHGHVDARQQTRTGVIGEEADGAAQARKEGLGRSGAAGGVNIMPHDEHTFGTAGVQGGAIRSQRHRVY
mmetsp:Transcript_56422/g.99100  ORF Transcript_56422/g.99100 Transcript_56422/m.99100 type:complete len:272 (+) Transcript_56422:1035-1850(+)